MGLRFYAGVPILAPNGHSIGTFSVMDSEPGALSEEEKGRLQDLDAMASDALVRSLEGRGRLRSARLDLDCREPEENGPKEENEGPAKQRGGESQHGGGRRR